MRTSPLSEKEDYAAYLDASIEQGSIDGEQLTRSVVVSMRKEHALGFALLKNGT
jgi:hypothetical protein